MFFKCLETLHGLKNVQIRGGSTIMAAKILKVKFNIPNLVSISMHDLLRAHEVDTTLHERIPLPDESCMRGLQAETTSNHFGGQVVKGPRVQLFWLNNRNIFRVKGLMEAKVIIVKKIHLSWRPTFKVIILLLLSSRKSSSQLKVVRTMATTRAT